MNRYKKWIAKGSLLFIVFLISITLPNDVGSQNQVCSSCLTGPCTGMCCAYYIPGDDVDCDSWQCVCHCTVCYVDSNGAPTCVQHWMNCWN